jgi:hypothetical protein
MDEIHSRYAISIRSAIPKTYLKYVLEIPYDKYVIITKDLNKMLIPPLFKKIDEGYYECKYSDLTQHIQHLVNSYITPFESKYAPEDAIYKFINENFKILSNTNTLDRYKLYIDYCNKNSYPYVIRNEFKIIYNLLYYRKLVLQLKPDVNINVKK